MKRILISVMLLLFVLVLSAHPADEIKVEFDNAEKMLQVEVEHSVSNATSHYIVEIKVQLNDEEIITQKFMQQNDNEKLTARYMIVDAEPGDELEISARCNKFGTKKLKYTIPEE